MGAVELKAPPIPAVDPTAAKPAEAVTQPNKDLVTSTTVDTTKAVAPAKEEPAKVERPQWLPEEFKTPEEMAQAYAKLKPQPPPVDAKKTEEGITKAGLDMTALSAEFAKDGKLSDDSMAKLEKVGITKPMVDAYVEGQKAQAAAYVTSVAESVGGQDNLNATLEWAGKSLTADEIAAANKALQSGDAAQARLVVAGLRSRMVAQQGQEPSLVQGRSGLTAGVAQGYESTQQWIADVNSHAYKTDPAFREKVARRVAVTKF